MQYRELVLLEKLQELTAPDADLEYSILRGKLDMDDVRAICEGLRIAIHALQTTQARPCADCGAPIGRDAGPPDGWQLEDGRTVCHRCCVFDMLQQLRKPIDSLTPAPYHSPSRQRGKLTARSKKWVQLEALHCCVHYPRKRHRVHSRCRFCFG